MRFARRASPICDTHRVVSLSPSLPPLSRRIYTTEGRDSKGHGHL